MSLRARDFDPPERNNAGHEQLLWLQGIMPTPMKQDLSAVPHVSLLVDLQPPPAAHGFRLSATAARTNQTLPFERHFGLRSRLFSDGRRDGSGVCCA